MQFMFLAERKAFKNLTTCNSWWWSLDKDNAEGREMNSSTSACDYSKLINKPTHVTKESS